MIQDHRLHHRQLTAIQTLCAFAFVSRLLCLCCAFVTPPFTGGILGSGFCNAALHGRHLLPYSFFLAAPKK
jgi:hypothetical protein